MTGLMLLPGMMCDARLYGPQIDALADHYDIRVGDITGHADMTALAQSVFDQAPWERFAVAGLSMGGIVAMEMVRLASERVERLALLDTNQRAEIEERKALRVPQIDRAKAGDLKSVLIDEMKPNYLAPANRTNQKLLDVVLNMGLDLGEDVFERQSLALRDRRDQSQTLSLYEGNTLVLCGVYDALCPVERHEEIANLISKSTLNVIPDCGHLSTLEAPQVVTRALQEWLNQ